MKRAFAAIDCGTNSTRLLISDGVNDQARETIITGLGRGVQASGSISEEAMQRCLNALRKYSQEMEAFEIIDAKAVATSAVRDASNGQSFLSEAKSVLGFEPSVITGDQEAHYSFSGAVHSLDPASGPYLVFDIGGGSTEFAYGIQSATHTISADMGSVRFSELHLHDDPPTAAQLEQCSLAARELLETVVDQMPDDVEEAQLVGLAGTVSSTASIALGLDDYDREVIHHQKVAPENVANILSQLASQDRAGRLNQIGLEAGRVDTIVAGLCILDQILKTFSGPANPSDSKHQKDLLVSEADILEGIILELSAAAAESI